MKWFNDNWRWQDVPFYLRTGTCLPVQASEISIQFRAVPHQSFPPEASLGWQASRLILAIRPAEQKTVVIPRNLEYLLGWRLVCELYR